MTNITVPDAAFYDASYYGNTATPTSNYRGYRRESEPGWSKPLAEWLVANTRGPWLDAGCAFGHLVRDLNAAAKSVNGQWAGGAEWSEYATANTVGPHHNIWRADVRSLEWVFGDGTFGTVISMDLLEHFAPDDTKQVIAELTRVCVPFGLQCHLIGWPLPGNEDGHYDDPTHQNHEPIGWYRAVFAERGWRLHKPLTRDLNLHPRWKRTPWRGRWQVYARR